MRIWKICTLNQLFIKDSYTEIKFSKQLSSYDKPVFFVIG